MFSCDDDTRSTLHHNIFIVNSSFFVLCHIQFRLHVFGGRIEWLLPNLKHDKNLNAAPRLKIKQAKKERKKAVGERDFFSFMWRHSFFGSIDWSLLSTGLIAAETRIVDRTLKLVPNQSDRKKVTEYRALFHDLYVCTVNCVSFYFWIAITLFFTAGQMRRRFHISRWSFERFGWFYWKKSVDKSDHLMRPHLTNHTLSIY